MALEIWWGSGSPYSWRALLALEYKQLSYVSHLVQFAKQEHKAPALVKMNPRGRVPVLKDDDYVCFESLAILRPHHPPREPGVGHCDGNQDERQHSDRGALVVVELFDHGPSGSS